MITIIPAIDIIDSKCVRLSKGDYHRQTTYPDSPLDMALKFADAGVSRIHLVDLDGAKSGAPQNLRTLEEIAAHTSLAIEWGGGIKSRQALADIFNAGANFAIIGSLAVKQPELMHEWLSEFGGGKIILGADIRNGKVAVNGWLEESMLSVDNLIREFSPSGLNEAIVTDISKDGMLEGPATELYTSLSEKFPHITFTVSGGISSMQDIVTLNNLGLPRVIVGKAIYEGRISLQEISGFIHAGS